MKKLKLKNESFRVSVDHLQILNAWGKDNKYFIGWMQIYQYTFNLVLQI